MLRALVLLLLLLNVGLYFWIHGDPRLMDPDREPQRLERQVAPDAIQVVPDLPVALGAAVAPLAASAAVAADAAQGAASAASAPASSPASPSTDPSTAANAGKPGDGAVTLARPNPADLDCVESDPLDDTRLAALRQTLLKSGLKPDTIAVREQLQGGTWLVYLGRFADAQAGQQKADELKRLNLKFERVSKPPALAPGLSLGSYASAADASAHLADFARQGVHTARVVQSEAPTPRHRLQVRSPDASWRLAVGAQRFGACPIPAAP